MVKWGACGHPLREKRVVVGSDGSTAIIRTYPPWCQVCATADDTTEAQNARLIDGSGLRAEERERWRGREQEANAWMWAEMDGSFSTPVATPAAQYAVEQTLRALRARDIVGVVLLSHTADAEALNVARKYLAEAHRASQAEPAEWWREDDDAADARVGHRRRVVDEVVERLCPPASRGWDFHGDTYLGLPMPRHLVHVLCEGAGIAQRYG